MKRRILPNSSRSAPLAGGRFRRPAKTHAGTPSGAHFSHHLQVWRPAGGAVAAPGRRLRVRGPPMRDRMRPREADMCQAPAPRDSPLGGRGRAPSPRHRRRATHLHAGSRGTRRQGHPGRELGAGRYPIPCDYKVCSCGWLRHRPGGVGVRSEHLSEHHEGHGAVDVVGPVAPPGARPAVGTKECTQIGKNDLSEPFRGIRVHCCTVADRHGGAGVYTDRRKRLLGIVLRHSYTLLRREDRASRDASRVGWHECPNHHGVPAAPTRWPSPPWSGKRALREWRRS